MIIIKARKKHDTPMTQHAYDRKETGIGESYDKKQKRMVSYHW